LHLEDSATLKRLQQKIAVQNPLQNRCCCVALFAACATFATSQLFPSLLITAVSRAVDVADKTQGEVVFAVWNVVWNLHLGVGCERLSCSLGFVGVLLCLAGML
jgi:hypothetical protein